MRMESEEYNRIVTDNTTPSRVYAVLAFFPRAFFGGAAFFSFFAAMRADTRARAAYCKVFQYFANASARDQGGKAKKCEEGSM